MFRYVAMLWDAPSLERSAKELEQRLLSASPGWQRVFESQGIGVWVADPSACFGVHRLCDQAGVVLGEAFARNALLDNDTPAPDAKFNRMETWEALKSEGRSLARKFWGNFVALIVEHGAGLGGRAARYVFKDPSGTLPCHLAKVSGVQVIFSNLQDCLRLGLSIEVNWDFVTSRAVNGFLDFEIPPLLGVSTVHRGECATFDQCGVLKSRAIYWHPAHFDRSSELITDSEQAARILRASVRSCVHSMARHHECALVQTSGGLDSSIVLGCLSDAPSEPKLVCYTIYASDAVCDERRWARLAAQRAGHRHMEILREPNSLLFKDLPALAPSVEPAQFFSHWQRGPMDRDLSAEQGASATFTGEGGDSTLCAITYSYAAEHAFRHHGLGKKTWQTALQVASRRDRTVWKVLGKAIGREIFGAGRADELRRRATFNRLVSLEAKLAADGQPVGTTWLSAGGHLSQEIRLRLGELLFPPVFYDLSTSASDASPYIASPLCAQPVVEACLRIPAHLHFDGGRIRGLARRAFADVLPAPILQRQWKDRPMLFFEDVVQANLHFIRERLLEGELAKQGILDRAQVELALAEGPSRGSAESGEILSQLDLELWVRNSIRRA